jgi:hypothetical protein
VVEIQRTGRYDLEGIEAQSPEDIKCNSCEFVKWYNRSKEGEAYLSHL